MIEEDTFYNNLYEYDYDLDIYEREAKFSMKYGNCKECFQEIVRYGCLSCNPRRFQRDFGKWTSGNKNINELIQDCQLSALDHSGLLEWIPYNRFTDIKYMAKGGSAKVYSATWIDGYIVSWNQVSNIWQRKGSFKVALKVLNNSKNISEDFLNEIKYLKVLSSKVDYSIIKFYGITQVPTTLDYTLVFKLEDSDLRFYLYQNDNTLTWNRKLDIIERICLGIKVIHNNNLIHKNLHIGNILLSISEFPDDICISDVGFCKPANENLNSSKSKIYGVMPYMAPEILCGQEYTRASDIYSLGIIINEVISIIPPFNKEPHDFYLALDICHGKRPIIGNRVPKEMKELINKCWSANPGNRPTALEIHSILGDFMYTINMEVYFNSLYEAAISTYNSITTNLLSKTHKTSPQTIHISQPLNLPNLPEPENCENQEDFISSRDIVHYIQTEVNNLNENTGEGTFKHKGHKEQSVIIFRLSDYNLNRDERIAKFMNYDLIICEKCYQKIDLFDSDHYCRDRHYYKRCKECFQVTTQLYGCGSCNSKRFQQDFDKWISGNKNIDELIQNSQLTAKSWSKFIEWIPYNRLTDIKYIVKDGFAKVYSATWIDGYIVSWNQASNIWQRKGSFKVALKVLNNSKNISEDFLNEVKSLKVLASKADYSIIKFYGITQVPTTLDYALVFKLEDSGLRFYLNQNCNTLTWKRKFDIIERICYGLRTIHEHELIHKDLHMGNILQSSRTDSWFEQWFEPCISDSGLCKASDENSSNSKIYGVMPYMAPEILHGKKYTQASNIYSLGIIINEVISFIPPFHKEPHDYYLALDICYGKRPIVGKETPEFLKELIQKCWDANPNNRPTASEIHNNLRYIVNIKGHYKLIYNVIMTNLSSETLKRHPQAIYISQHFNLSSETLKRHPQAIYISQHFNLPNLPKYVNCENQEDFISSRDIVHYIQTGVNNLNENTGEGIFKHKEHKEQSVIIFRLSDYNLNIDERMAKFMNYDLILCEKCYQKIDLLNPNHYCRDRHYYKRCKECFQVITQLYGCESCNPKRFQQDFDKWTSGNKNIDELIQNSQLTAKSWSKFIEWIPYNRFTDIKYIAKGGFAKVYSATWIDGYIVSWNQASSNWQRMGPFKVALKVLNNSSKNISEDFLSEVKSLKVLASKTDYSIIKFYGITQDPITLNYALVFKLEDSGLRFYLNQNYDTLPWEKKLDIIERICYGLRSIHRHGLIHKDLHIGNILQSTKTNSWLDPCISDFGFCKPADENSSKSRIYGVIPYMAPEILRGQEYTQASDIYSLGIIINEIISIILPFPKEPHDYYLALDICYGKRPKIREETPEFLKELIQKCWDANPENRPTVSGIIDMLIDFRYTKNEDGKYNYEECTKQYEELINLSTITENLSLTTQLFETHPQASYISRLLNLPNLPEPINCQNQDEFVSSRNIVQVQPDVTLYSSECLDCEIID